MSADPHPPSQMASTSHRIAALKPIGMGAAAGLVASSGVGLFAAALTVSEVSLLPVGSSGTQIGLHLGAAIGLGATIGYAVPCRPRGHAALAAGGTLTALLWWLVGPLTLVPLLAGNAPTWSAEIAAQRFPNLVSALLFGSLTGLLLAAFNRLVRGPVTVESAPVFGYVGNDQDPSVGRGAHTKVVILGGGFGGIGAAQRLEERQPHKLGIDVTLISRSNSLLFTPMLAEVAGSALEPQHISSPIRASIPRTRFIRGTVNSIDTDAKVVHLSGSPTKQLSYDHLVLALGSVPHFRDLPGVQEHSFTLKSLKDAVRLRNHVIARLEQADVTTNAAERQRLLTFVVAGAGFAGTEMVAELFDLAHSTLRYYPNVPIGELRFVLVHSGDRILPEIGPELADYALEKLQTRGIEFRLGVRVASATADALQLNDGSTIPTATFVWTAGNRPSPLLSHLACDHVGTGAVVAEETMKVSGLDDVWALGDNAAIPDPFSNTGTSPPTAQHASRQGKALADNIVATIIGQSPKPFRFKALGILVALGHRTAVAEIRGIRFSGLFAWLLWRSIYLAKLPGLEQKARVLFDWTLDLFFPRDITLDGGEFPEGADAEATSR